MTLIIVVGGDGFLLGVALFPENFEKSL
jgi:hypothetical protein